MHPGPESGGLVESGSLGGSGSPGVWGSRNPGVWDSKLRGEVDFERWRTGDVTVGHFDVVGDPFNKVGAIFSLEGGHGGQSLWWTFRP